jgi:hypothetical protein
MPGATPLPGGDAAARAGKATFFLLLAVFAAFRFAVIVPVG